MALNCFSSSRIFNQIPENFTLELIINQSKLDEFACQKLPVVTTVKQPIKTLSQIYQSRTSLTLWKGSATITRMSWTAPGGRDMPTIWLMGNLRETENKIVKINIYRVLDIWWCVYPYDRSKLNILFFKRTSHWRWTVARQWNPPFDDIKNCCKMFQFKGFSIFFYLYNFYPESSYQTIQERYSLLFGRLNYGDERDRINWINGAFVGFNFQVFTFGEDTSTCHFMDSRVCEMEVWGLFWVLKRFLLVLASQSWAPM